ncbi:hypothetical protein NKG94_05835 [Micromonospora sp. M12]
MELTLDSDPQSPVGAALTTSAPDGRGGATVTWWPVDQPGAYRLVLGYLRRRCAVCRRTPVPRRPSRALSGSR